MSRLATSLLALALGAAATSALVACGEEDAKLLPGQTAQEIRENLDSVQSLADEGECEEAEGAALEVSSQVEELREIDPELKQALEEGAARLNEVIVRCQDEAPEDTVEEELVPTVSESAKEQEQREKDAEKEQEKLEKEEEKAAKEQEDEQEEEEPGSDLPPQANGKAKGHEEAPPSETPAETPSGGIGPGAEAKGEGD
jgi:hypothetical protein